MHTYAWQQGLKTNQYYLHSESKIQAQQFVVAPTAATAGVVAAGGSSTKAKIAVAVAVDKKKKKAHAPCVVREQERHAARRLFSPVKKIITTDELR